MEEYIFDSWKELMTEFRQSVQKDLEEIHAQKQAVQQMKAEIFRRMDSGRYYRDPDRIVISAPQIVIGNVDYSGDLIGGTGSVIVKGSNLSFEGVGNDGQVVTRAPKIRQTAVNPGIDGQENVVCNTSEVVTQACGIVIQSNNATDVFSQGPATLDGRGGIRIHADQSLQLSATNSCERRKNQIENKVTALEMQIEAMEQDADGKQKSVEKCLNAMKELLDHEDKLNREGDFAVRQNTKGIDFIHEAIDKLLPTLYQETTGFLRTISALAEANRMKTALNKEKESIPEEESFKEGCTNAQMSIVGEQINMATLDGDGYLHTNVESGVNIRTSQMDINMTDAHSKLVKDSSLSVTTENVMLSSLDASNDAKEYEAKGSFRVFSKDIELSSMDYRMSDEYPQLIEKNLTKDGNIMMRAKTVTVSAGNPKDMDYDKDGKLAKGELNAEGDVYVLAKNINVESIDYEVKEGKFTLKDQTKDSGISLHTENLSMLSADKDGKATGSVTTNAKAITMKSMDIDKDSHADKSLAAGSSMTLVSEGMNVGAISKEIKSKKIQTTSEEVGITADKTLEAQQGDGKVVHKLEGGKVSMKADSYTVEASKMDVKADLSAPKAVINDLQVKTHLKSMNIEDGM